MDLKNTEKKTTQYGLYFPGVGDENSREWKATGNQGTVFRRNKSRYRMARNCLVEPDVLPHPLHSPLNASHHRCQADVIF